MSSDMCDNWEYVGGNWIYTGVGDRSPPNPIHRPPSQSVAESAELQQLRSIRVATWIMAGIAIVNVLTTLIGLLITAARH